MNYIITGVIILIIGYAFGCFSTGYFVGKKNGLDIRLTGSGNIGTTNALRSLGAKSRGNYLFRGSAQSIYPNTCGKICLLSGDGIRG